MGNIVTANFSKGRLYQTNAIYQYNSGMVLKFKGLTLPDTYRVDFSNTLHGTSKTMIGNENGVTIPDEYLKPGTMVYAWIVLNSGESGVVTEYQVNIPIDQRAKPTDVEPSENQQGVIDQLIGEMNSAVEKTEENVKHYPKIVDGYWYSWNAETDDFVNTGFKATGQNITVNNTTLVVEPI